MARQSQKQMFPMLALAVGILVSHLAMPAALFAQNSATMRVSVNVLPATAAWEAQELQVGAVQHLIDDLAVAADGSAQGGAASGAGDVSPVTAVATAPVAPMGTARARTRDGIEDYRREERGTVVWLDRPLSHQAQVTVAHLAN
jgi:hypothetical protein